MNKSDIPNFSMGFNSSIRSIPSMNLQFYYKNKSRGGCGACGSGR